MIQGAIVSYISRNAPAKSKPHQLKLLERMDKDFGDQISLEQVEGEIWIFTNKGQKFIAKLVVASGEYTVKMTQEDWDTYKNLHPDTEAWWEGDQGLEP